MRKGSLLFVALSMGCADGGTFSDGELEVIRTRLGELPAAPTPDPSNAFADSEAAAALGHKFFFETRYSSNGQVSCATCHNPATGFQDDRANTSQGLAFTERHAPTLINSAYGSAEVGATIWSFWDGRTDSQWAQAIGPPESDVEMGGSRATVAYLIYDLYRAEYETVFGVMPDLRDPNGAAYYPTSAQPGDPAWDQLPATVQDELTLIYVNFGKSIAAYEAKLVSRNSRFDQFHREIAGGMADSDVLTQQEKEGLRLFLGKAGCLECHVGPNFTDGKFHNIGLTQAGPNLPSSDAGRSQGIAALLGSEYHCATRWSDHPNQAECAIHTVATAAEDLGSFKTPGLRSLSTTAPYMHTGTVLTLEEVIDHYDEGGDPSGFAGNVDGKIAPLNLSSLEKARLAAFLRTLDGEAIPSALTTAPNLP